jgi:hypothetical protein
MDWLKEIERFEAEGNNAAIILRDLYNENNRLRKFNKEVAEINKNLTEENQRLISQRHKGSVL